MVKTLIKIVIALIVIHGAFRIGSAYWNFYRFEDALQQAAQFGERRSDKQICDEAMTTAANYGIPIAASALSVRRGSAPPFNCEEGQAPPQGGALTPLPLGHMLVEGVYVEKVQLLPGYVYPWEFKPSVNVLVRP
jgi:hypothetical protein